MFIYRKRFCLSQSHKHNYFLTNIKIILDFRTGNLLVPLTIDYISRITNLP